MGGMGSGWRWRYGTRSTTEGYRTIDVRRWYREKLLSPNNSFVVKWTRDGETQGSIQVKTEINNVKLIYRHKADNDDWENLSYPVYLTWTPCNYGNKRPWFLCPAKNCGRRVAILYSGKIFACRHCYQLSYESQRETPPYRATRQADKIRERLNWEEGCLNGGGSKPKGMHRKTFNRLYARHNRFVARGLAWFGCGLDMIEGRIEDWL